MKRAYRTMRVRAWGWLYRAFTLTHRHNHPHYRHHTFYCRPCAWLLGNWWWAGERA